MIRNMEDCLELQSCGVIKLCDLNKLQLNVKKCKKSTIARTKRINFYYNVNGYSIEDCNNVFNLAIN